MGVVRRFAAAGLEQAARRGNRHGGLVIGAIDETGQEKAGQVTCGVKRQYLGCAGRVANGINTVHLSYVREGTGHALIGARQWIPRAWLLTASPHHHLLVRRLCVPCRCLLGADRPVVRRVRAWDRSLAMAERAAAELQPHARGELGCQVLGMLTLRCALSAAAAQDGVLAEHWLGAAQALTGRVNDDDPARNWEWFGATNVAIWRVAIAVERGESGRAVLKLAAAADPAKLIVATRRAALYLDVGRGLARLTQ
jgi:hypothetical protein